MKVSVPEYVPEAWPSGMLMPQKVSSVDPDVDVVVFIRSKPLNVLVPVKVKLS